MSAGVLSSAEEPTVTEPVAAYKRILRGIIDKRPSGMRLKIANALGKHKSFVSQITNPAYPVPVPARHLETIFDICRFSPEERTEFLEAYARAHPGRAPVPGPGGGRRYKMLTIEIPRLDDPRKQEALEEFIHNLVRRLSRLME
ncbi:MAG TPA: hypothetical protein VFO41_15675 [Alphaproteobacteria bacterium]|nr:hypothetical protein [Alphaproteobacteria bacterium]